VRAILTTFHIHQQRVGSLALCRLAKFRDLIIIREYGAVIGHKTRVFVCALSQFPGIIYEAHPCKEVISSQLHRRISPQSSNHEFCQNDNGEPLQSDSTGTLRLPFWGFFRYVFGYF